MERLSNKTKICIKCNQSKSVDLFHTSKTSSDGFRSYCKPCNSVKLSEWRAANPEKAKAERRAWYLANKEKVKTAAQRWHANNPDKTKAASEKWAAANADRCRDRVQKRRNIKRGNGGTYTTKQWKELCAKFNNVCLDCGEQKPLTVDHVLPVSMGGTSFIENLQPLCLSCNSRKRDKAIDFRLKWKSVEMLNQPKAMGATV